MGCYALLGIIFKQWGLCNRYVISCTTLLIIDKRLLISLDVFRSQPADIQRENMIRLCLIYDIVSDIMSLLIIWACDVE